MAPSIVAVPFDSFAFGRKSTECRPSKRLSRRNLAGDGESGARGERCGRVRAKRDGKEAIRERERRIEKKKERKRVRDREKEKRRETENEIER